MGYFGHAEGGSNFLAIFFQPSMTLTQSESGVDDRKLGFDAGTVQVLLGVKNVSACEIFCHASSMLF